MPFDFGLLQPFVDDPMITDVDSNSRCVYVRHQQKGVYHVLDLEDGYLEDMLVKMSNYWQINAEFNRQNPVMDGTMDDLRIHAVHKSVMNPYCWLSIRKNPLELVVQRSDYPEIFDLIDVANSLGWSYVFGGERGSGKTQLMRTCMGMFPKNRSVAIIAENDEMHMVKLLSDRLVSQYIINEDMPYSKCAKSVLRDNSDYVVFQEVRDEAIDDLFLILSSSSRVLTTLHVKNALLMPQRMIQLSSQKNDNHLLSTIHDYIQMCIVPIAVERNGKIERWIKEIAVFWNDRLGTPYKDIIYRNDDGDHQIFYDIPNHFKEIFKKNRINLEWKERER